MNKIDKMIDALNHYDIAKVKKYIREGFDLYESMPEEPVSFFNLVVKSDSLEKVKFLMDLGADPNIPDEGGFTPIFIASIISQNINMVNLLLDYGAKYDTEFKELPLIEYLVAKGMTEIANNITDRAIREVYDREGDLDDIISTLGVQYEDTFNYVVDRIEIYIKEMDKQIDELKKELKMPLMYNRQAGYSTETTEFIEKCKTESIAEIEKLLKTGEDINQKDGYGYTGLMWAIEKENYEVAKYLINEGADINIKSKTDAGNTALYASISDENPNLELVELLIEKGANVNDANERNENCLQAAVMSGNLDLVNLLIEYDVDVNFMVSVDEVGVWAYLNYEKESYLDIMEVLIDAGLEINKQDSIGYTALLEMASNGHLDIIKLLVKNGADINLAKDDETTPLMLATYEDHEEIVKYLVKECADIDAVNAQGNTALIAGCLNGSYGAVKVLLKYGANIQIENENGMTAIQIAEENGYNEIVKLISRYI